MIEEKRAHLAEILRGYGSIAVAYSGGVDSTFLAAFANDVLPGKVVLLTGMSASFPEDEADFVRRFAADRQLRLRLVNTDELNNESYASNPPSRCYFCKTELFTRLWPIAREEGMAVLADGANADDLRDFRPGLKAAAELEVRHPLQEADLSKEEIRELSHQMNLPTWDKPAYACLASRFPYGERITAPKLRRVELAERLLRQRGFRVFRVRSHQTLARLEIGRDELDRAFAMREELVRELRQLGFAFVTLDLAGFRSGSMNDLLKLETDAAK